MVPSIVQPHHPSAVHATLGFLLSKAAYERHPDRPFFIEHSFLGGYYCHFGNGWSPSPDALSTLTETIASYLSGSPLEIDTLDAATLENLFTRLNRSDKLDLLPRLGSPITVLRHGNFVDYCLEPVTLEKNDLKQFSIDPYDQGFLLRFPGLLPPYEIPPLKDSPKLYQVIQQREEWGRALHVNNLWQLNHRVQSGGGRELICIAEGLHEKHIAQLADDLVAGLPKKRVVFIAGPSSSGKTTFAKRLKIQLQVDLHNALLLSMDDYFLDHAAMRPEPDGALDFESLAALDVDRLVTDVRRLLKGETIPKRAYSFKSGKGIDTSATLSLPEDDFLILEGIHGLNPVFAQALGADTIQRIYISAITQLNIDNEHRVSSSDCRLIRRIVRDAQFRGYSAEDTLLRWPSVRLGEEKHIFTFQEEADLMFNSALIYELAVLRCPAEAALSKVPSASEAYSEARRLMTFLSLLEILEPDKVLHTSILREFLGGSAFDY